MSALILKSQNALNPDVDTIDFAVYKQRVLDDGGVIFNEQSVKDAISFVYQNNIKPAEVFSATSASWGVKVVAGNPIKLYSLFGSTGDIDVTVGADASIDFDTHTYAFATIALRAASANRLLTSKVNNVNSSGMCIIAKAPVLSAGTTYGTETRFTLGELANLQPVTVAQHSESAKMLSISYVRTASSGLPNVWTQNAIGYGVTGALNPITGAGDATKWSHVSTFLDSTGLFAYNDGVLASSDLTVTPTIYKDDNQFMIGVAREPWRNGNAAYVYPLYAHVAEAWCLINTTKEKMQAVSLRASQKYPNL